MAEVAEASVDVKPKLGNVEPESGDAAATAAAAWAVPAAARDNVTEDDALDDIAQDDVEAYLVSIVDVASSKRAVEDKVGGSSFTRDTGVLLGVARNEVEVGAPSPSSSEIEVLEA